jgi:hypothetical protein
LSASALIAVTASCGRGCFSTRALLNRNGDPFLSEWEHDRTTRAERARLGAEPDPAKRRGVETEITRCLQGRFSFMVFRVDDRDDRLRLESRIISTVSRCDECRPSAGWLGLSSPKENIRTSGSWLVNELRKEPLAESDLERLETLLT